MLLGTHTSGKGTDQLMIAEVMLPKVQGETSGGKDVTDLYDEDRQGKPYPLFSSFPAVPYSSGEHEADLM
jgi:hypothetical protein